MGTLLALAAPPTAVVAHSDESPSARCAPSARRTRVPDDVSVVGIEPHVRWPRRSTSPRCTRTYAVRRARRRLLVDALAGRGPSGRPSCRPAWSCGQHRSASVESRLRAVESRPRRLSRALRRLSRALRRLSRALRRLIARRSEINGDDSKARPSPPPCGTHGRRRRLPTPRAPAQGAPGREINARQPGHQVSPVSKTRGRPGSQPATEANAFSITSAAASNGCWGVDVEWFIEARARGAHRHPGRPEPLVPQAFPSFAWRARGRRRRRAVAPRPAACAGATPLGSARDRSRVQRRRPHGRPRRHRQRQPGAGARCGRRGADRRATSTRGCARRASTTTVVEAPGRPGPAEPGRARPWVGRRAHGRPERPRRHRRRDRACPRRSRRASTATGSSGRGAADMKGGVAAIVVAAEHLVATGARSVRSSPWSPTRRTRASAARPSSPRCPASASGRTPA